MSFDAENRNPASEALEKYLSEGNKYYVHLDYDKIENLLRQGAAVDTVNDRHESGLWLACIQDNHEICELFLKYGANPSISNISDGTSALHMASCYLRGDPDIFAQICRRVNECGGNLDQYENIQNNSHFSNALMYAVHGDNHKNIEVILKATARVDPTNSSQQNTALMVAAERGRYRCALLLLKNRADPNRRNEHEQTALHYAAGCGHAKLVSKLLLNGAYINAQDDGGKTALHISIWESHKRTTDILLAEDNQNLDLISDSVGSALHYAVRGGDVSILTKLLDRGANVDIVNENKQTALLLAISEFYMLGYEKFEDADCDGKDKVLLLLNRDANVNLIDDEIGSPLHYAVKWADIGFSDMLLDFDADINIQNKSKETALYESAARIEHYEMTSALLARKANMNIQNRKKRTPLHISIYKGNFRIAMLLLEQGADTKLQDFYGDSVLHYAAKSGNKEIVSEIVKQKKDLNNIKNIAKRTALHIAVGMCGSANLTKDDMNIRISIISTLIDDETDLSIRDIDGNTPMDMAFQSKVETVIDLFEKHVQDSSVAAVMMAHPKLGAKSHGWALSDETVKEIAMSYRSHITKYPKTATLMHLENVDQDGDASGGD